MIAASILIITMATIAVSSTEVMLFIPVGRPASADYPKDHIRLF